MCCVCICNIGPCCRIQLPDLRYIDCTVDFSVKTFNASVGMCKDLGLRHPEELSLCKPLDPEHLRQNYQVISSLFKLSRMFSPRNLPSYYIIYLHNENDCQSECLQNVRRKSEYNGATNKKVVSLDDLEFVIKVGMLTFTVRGRR